MYKRMPPLDPPAPPEPEPIVLPEPAPIVLPEPAPIILPGARAPLSTGGGQLPTVADFYHRLGRLEARAEHATNLLVEVLARQAPETDLLEELVADAREEEEAETSVDMQKIGQMAASAQKWAYISIAAVLVWKVAASTWKQCGSPPLAAAVSAMRGNRPQHPSGPETGAGPQPPAVRDAGPGDPFYMA
ncbi:hypothetical protein ElyMa_001471100 [Elysia marginata]|uniref:Uncharacterized protein n=1 Tax=Elysia marginata TaxID=1093978 RepID=A0AAV4J241_9GAST|nr:hypothetical protein ElyMa_001471100 [Elysia marginata]